MSKGGSSLVTRFKYGYVIQGEELVIGDVWVRGGKIIDPHILFYEEKRLPDRVIDCTDLIVAPGFIDIQINGAFGVDFSTLDEDRVCEGVRRVASGLLRYGVTSFCPTIVTSPRDYYHKVLPQMKAHAGGKDGASILGAHLEGPFISLDKKGAHDENSILSSVSPSSLMDCYCGPNPSSLDNVRVVTLAPELPGAMETIKWLSAERNVFVSLGHSVAQVDTAQQAVLNGASIVTHLFNAMLPFHHRDPGLIGLLTSHAVGGRPVYYGLIADGYHTHSTVATIAYLAHPDGVVLVSDAVGATGLGEGHHNLGSMDIEVQQGSARVAGTDTLAGSVATMDACVRTFKRATGCSTAKALRAASLHPARALGIQDSKGSLERGRDADLVILDHDLNVQATIIAGEVVWVAPGSRIAV